MCSLVLTAFVTVTQECVLPLLNKVDSNRLLHLVAQTGITLKYIWVWFLFFTPLTLHFRNLSTLNLKLDFTKSTFKLLNYMFLLTLPTAVFLSASCLRFPPWIHLRLTQPHRRHIWRGEAKWQLLHVWLRSSEENVSVQITSSNWRLRLHHFVMSDADVIGSSLGCSSPGAFKRNARWFISISTNPLKSPAPPLRGCFWNVFRGQGSLPAIYKEEEEESKWAETLDFISVHRSVRLPDERAAVTLPSSAHIVVLNEKPPLSSSSPLLSAVLQ